MDIQDISSPRKYAVTINYTHPGTQPPIYVAGTFTTPPWEPHELHHTAIKSEGRGIQDREYEFHKEFEVEKGRWQYKLRAGLGDWWMLDEQAVIVTDDVGNRNNLLVVGPETHNVVPPSGSPPSKDGNHGTAAKDFEPSNTNFNVSQRQTGPDIDPLRATNDNPGSESTENPSDPEPRPARLPPVDEHVDGDTEVSHTLPVEEIPIPITVVEKVPDEDPPIYGDIEQESLHEDEQARQADAEPDEMIVLSSPPINEGHLNNGSRSEIPLIVVEKADFTASHGDDMGPDATQGQKLAHAQRAMDAQPDAVIVVPNPENAEVPQHSGRIDTPTIKIADTAAEVADTAAMLDASPRSSRSADYQVDSPARSYEQMSEVGRTAAEAATFAALVDKSEFTDHRPDPHQEYSSSLLDIANTAAEVADSAAAIDPDPVNDDITAFASAVGYSQSDTESPRLEYAPLLSHERMSDVSPEASQRDSMPHGSSLREVQASEDLDDPSLEPFPTDYNGILERIRSTESRLNEDVVSESGASVSPVTSRPRLTFRGRLSPTVVSDDGQSPVLLSITEASEEDDAKVPDPPPISLPEAVSSPTNDAPQGNDEYFVGDEAAFTSSRSSRRSTINTREGSLPTNTFEQSQATNTKAGFGVEAIMQAHALSLRNGRQAGSIDDNLALDGAIDVKPTDLDGSLYQDSLPEGTVINVQERSTSVTPPSNPSEALYEFIEQEDSQEHPKTSAEVFGRANEIHELGSLAHASEGGLRQRNPSNRHGVRDGEAPTIMENVVSENQSQNVILAYWIAFVNWISGFLSRLRGSDRG
ncbi:MAG: hypothetical protein M1812_001312 [Candelaria pacifica]|nr:MAG: hypothetical protein M1812_001312 [Candelaria pacifica]